MPVWSLPESIADILPSEARKIEDLRRVLLDLFRTYGYELVMPPLLEYTESLLTGTGRDMDLQMFKLVDQLSGRTMGVRADMTPQVARIDAHLLNRKGVARLCYAGSVLHTRPSALFATREPFQVGAEIYGHAGLEADLEIQQLLLAALKLTGVPEVRLDLSHAEVLRAILAEDPNGLAFVDTIYPLLQTKDAAALFQLNQLSAQTRDALVNLCDLYGDIEVIAAARKVLPKLDRINAALDALDTLVKALPSAQTHAQITIDLADLRGYHYESGVIFSAYCPGLPSPVARGGRYDEVGEAFGRARPAAGFSLYLRELASLLPAAALGVAIRAPWAADAALAQKIAGLREQGEIVIQVLPGHEQEQDEFACDRELIFRASAWTVQKI